MKKRDQVLDKISLVLIDAGVILLSLSLAFYIRFSSGLIPYDHPFPSIPEYVNLSLTVLPFWILFNFFYKLYNSNIVSFGIEEYIRVVHTSAFGMIIIMIVSFMLKKTYTRGWVILSWLIVTVIMVSARYIFRKIKYIQNKRGFNKEDTLIIGTNEEGKYIYERIRSAPHLGLNVVGFIGEESANPSYPEILGRVEDLETVIEQNKNIGTVILVASALSSRLMQDIYRLLNKLDISAFVSPSLLNIISSRVAVQPVAGVPLITIDKTEFRGLKLLAKRIMDIALTVAGLIILLPVLLLIALIIRIDSKGKALFKQKRVGRKGKSFMLYKFRTMTKNAEEKLGEIKHLNEAEGKIFKIKEDPRITRVGRFLRKYSLDEFPQIINVLKGEMSLVGPRPPIPSEVAKYDEWEKQRLQALPGMTGLWQVSGRSELPFGEMVKLDIYYIENWSPLFDLYILLKTIPIVLKSKGAY